MIRIDLNADIGESYGAFRTGNDEELMTVITSANIACGFHAGDYSTIPMTIQLAKKNSVGVGAHPGFMDLFGFGRRSLQLSSEEIYQLVVYQIGAIQAFCKVENVPLIHVKPHGALYNIAATDYSIANSIARAVHDVDANLILFGLCNGELLRAGEDYGLTVAAEAFADRTYTDDGQLLPRSERNSIHTDIEAIEKQVLEIVMEGKVTTLGGNQIALRSNTICFHGDGLNVYQYAKRIRDVLIQKGVHVKNVGD